MLCVSTNSLFWFGEPEDVIEFGVVRLRNKENMIEHIEKDFFVCVEKTPPMVVCADTCVNEDCSTVEDCLFEERGPYFMSNNDCKIWL